MSIHKQLLPVLSILLLVCIHRSTTADITVIKGRDIRPRGASPVGESGTIYKIVVTPAKETMPAFRYRFSTPPHKTIAGNAVTHYLRSLGERGLSFPWKAAYDETDGKVDDWYSLDTKTADIPLDQLKKYSGYFDNIVNNHLRRASMCRNADWGLAVEDLRGMEAIEFLLPSVQETRSMARALQLQLRLAIIEKRFDDAVELLRMTYQLGQDVNEFGVLVTSLVGCSEVNIANGGVLQFISTEGSPNLYWALAELPTPIIDQRFATRLDLSMPMRIFPELMDIRNVTHSKDEWKRLLRQYTEDASKLREMVKNSPNPQRSTNGDVMSLGFGLAGYSGAKKRMVQRGYTEDQIKLMCVSQVILMDAAFDIEHFSQAFEKTYYVPFEKSQEAANRIRQTIDDAAKTRLGAMITDILAPPTLVVREAGIRSDAGIHRLMVVESLRNHAAVHGEFPESLESLELPVRVNPMTGKPFTYSLENGTAVIVFKRGSSLERFEISIKK